MKEIFIYKIAPWLLGAFVVGGTIFLFYYMLFVLSFKNYNDKPASPAKQKRDNWIGYLITAFGVIYFLVPAIIKKTEVTKTILLLAIWVTLGIIGPLLNKRFKMPPWLKLVSNLVMLYIIIYVLYLLLFITNHYNIGFVLPMVFLFTAWDIMSFIVEKHKETINKLSVFMKILISIGCAAIFYVLSGH
ncbi:MAG: hypothetical protein WC614_09355 [bacterium]